jgi:hypothetical protein
LKPTIKIRRLMAGSFKLLSFSLRGLALGLFTCFAVLCFIDRV